MNNLGNILTTAAAVLFLAASCTDTPEYPGKNYECELDHTLTGSDASILACKATVNGASYEAPVTGNDITACIPLLSSETPVISFTLSEGATSRPDPSEITDWSVPQRFTITSANGQTFNEYTVTVDRLVAENVCNTSVRLATQSAVDEFGANGFTVLGSLYLYDNLSGDPITDLSPLSSVREIRTELEVHEIAAEVIEFPDLVYVGNFDMHSVSAKEVRMPSLRNVAGRYRIGNNDSGPMPSAHEYLTVLDLSSLEHIGRSLVVFWCSNLQTILSPVLRSVNEDVIIQGGVYTDLSFLKNLTRINGTLSISGNIASLEGFGVEYVETSFSLDVGGVLSLEPLSCLKRTRHLSLNNGVGVTSFKGLENIELSALDIVNFPAVTSSRYLPVRDGMEHVQLSTMEKLHDLECLQGIRRLGTLALVNLPSLRNMDVLSGIQSVDMLSLARLEGLTALPDFSLTRIPEKLSISMMSSLVDISGLASLTEVGALHIDNLLNLPSLSGLENLQKVTAGGIMLVNNKKIENLDAFSNLKEINFVQQTDNVTIAMNSCLADYTGMAELLIECWNAGVGGAPGVQIVQNKYNPTLAQLQNGEYVMP